MLKSIVVENAVESSTDRNYSSSLPLMSLVTVTFSLNCPLIEYRKKYSVQCMAWTPNVPTQPQLSNLQ